MVAALNVLAQTELPSGIIAAWNWKRKINLFHKSWYSFNMKFCMWCFDKSNSRHDFIVESKVIPLDDCNIHQWISCGVLRGPTKQESTPILFNENKMKINTDKGLGNRQYTLSWNVIGQSLANHTGTGQSQFTPADHTHQLRCNRLIPIRSRRRLCPAWY